MSDPLVVVNNIQDAFMAMVRADITHLIGRIFFAANKASQMRDVGDAGFARM